MGGGALRSPDSVERFAVAKGLPRASEGG